MKLILAVMLLVPSIAFAQSIPPTTTVLDRALQEASKEIVAQLQDGDVLTIDVDAGPDSKWVEAIVVRAANDRGLDVRTADASVALEVVPVNMSTVYESIPESDSILRVITLDLSVLSYRDGVKQSLTVAPRIDSLRCLRSQAIAAQSTQHHSTHGELPPLESSLWDDALEPVIFIGAAVATVVLLFTVRSQ